MRSEGRGAMEARFDGEPAGGALPIRPAGASHSCRVLVVDDDNLVRERLAALLYARRYEVEMAASGTEAMRVLSATRCHMVLTDWQMPDMDGLTLCRRVRRGIQDHYIYVLMLTIRATQHDLLTGLAAGADDYVVKGASTEEILARLDIGRRIVLANQSLDPRRGLSHADAATGAYNLSYLVQHLPRELARSQRHGHPLAVLTCAIDGFVGAEAGLEAGDALLWAFVERCAGCIRKGDWLARTGSNEFMIVLPETAAPGARCVARKLRYLFTKEPLCLPDDSIALPVRIAVTAVEPKLDPNSTLRIDALLRTAGGHPTAGRRLQDGRQAAAHLVFDDASDRRRLD